MPRCQNYGTIMQDGQKQLNIVIDWAGSNNKFDRKVFTRYSQHSYIHTETRAKLLHNSYNKLSPKR